MENRSYIGAKQNNAKGIAEAEEAIKNQPPWDWRGQYKKADQIRRKHRKKMAKVEPQIQTYRIYVTLECGHRTVFTLSSKAFRETPWRRRRIECDQCAKADPEWPEGVIK